ncbi:energy transducer TonB [candidate division MSBL1 archaeon SCGC-AAA382M17]|uniref:Energy transducer TonB n=1 Tax=candidate division MSBL1 archaeon SCGC-AAA382M17 TaxID=1698284 RepID=A0ABR5TNP3_9EURY|nr:energy transducer TonB [candidate division MSBL1 archaeon SCGC-AAA382M17]
MEHKKSKKADLERKKGLFLEIGFVVALGLVLLAFEWTSRPKKIEGFQQEREGDIVQEDVPITRQKKEKKPPPPPPQSTDVLNIVDDDVEIEDELRLEETEADENTEVSIDAFAQKEEEEEEEEQIFVVVEDMPQFKGGGINAFRKYVQENIEYPTVAAENGIEGTVFIKFVVDTDGGISNVTVMRGVDPALNEEAMSVIRNAPKWEPGQQRGQPVRVQFTIPIVFKLQ